MKIDDDGIWYLRDNSINSLIISPSLAINEMDFETNEKENK